MQFLASNLVHRSLTGNTVNEGIPHPVAYVMDSWRPVQVVELGGIIPITWMYHSTVSLVNDVVADVMD
jgi:hypothetical protein